MSGAKRRGFDGMLRWRSFMTEGWEFTFLFCYYFVEILDFMELFPFIFFCLISHILVFSSLLSSLFRLRSNVFLSFQKLFEKWEEECKNTPEGQPLPPRPKVSLLSLTSTLFPIFRFKPFDSLSFLPL